MTNVEALKALYAALGGDPADVAEDNLSAEVIGAMAALEFGGGEDDRFFVFSATPQAGVATTERNLIIGDGKTYADDIYPALTGGKIVICIYTDEQNRVVEAVPIYLNMGAGTVQESSAAGYSVAANTELFFTANSSPLKPPNASPKFLPTVSSTDNGKVLTVVNGKWAAAALPADNTPAG